MTFVICIMACTFDRPVSQWKEIRKTSHHQMAIVRIKCFGISFFRFLFIHTLFGQDEAKKFTVAHQKGQQQQQQQQKTSQLVFILA